MCGINRQQSPRSRKHTGSHTRQSSILTPVPCSLHSPGRFHRRPCPPPFSFTPPAPSRSPCLLPLVPGSLGYIGGFTEGASPRPHRRRLLRGVALFVLGFTLVFVVVNLLAGATGGWLVHY